MSFSFPEPINLVGLAAVLLQLALTVGVILRVMLTRHPPGSSFAWILLTTILPYFGFILYLCSVSAHSGAGMRENCEKKCENADKSFAISCTRKPWLLKIIETFQS